MDAAVTSHLPAGRRRWHYDSDPSGIPLADRAEVDRVWSRRSVPPSAYQARLEMVETVVEMEVGERRVILVRVQNTGTETWPWGDRRPQIRLAQRWADPTNGSVQFEGAHTLLVASVPPGTVFMQRMDIVAPDKAGSYLLVADMVHEEVTWFETTGPRPLVNIHEPG
jgi:hypothetical protein